MQELMPFESRVIGMPRRARLRNRRRFRQVRHESHRTRQAERSQVVWRRFFVAVGVFVIVLSIAGFRPSLVDAPNRTEPPTPFVPLHGAENREVDDAADGDRRYCEPLGPPDFADRSLRSRLRLGRPAERASAKSVAPKRMARRRTTSQSGSGAARRLAANGSESCWARQKSCITKLSGIAA